MGLLSKLFGGETKTRNPIILDYACVHTESFENPPPMTAKERSLAQIQAAKIRCSKCDPPGWGKFEVEKRNLELQMARRQK